MNFNLKKLTAMALTMPLILSLFPTVSLATSATTSELVREEVLLTEPQNRCGNIDMPRVGGKSLTEAYLRGEADESNATRTPLPSSYDSRDYGYLPPVRNQNPYGACWAFANIAAVEAYMIKHGITNDATGRAADRSIDLSEYHLAWFNYTNAYDKLGMLNGDSTAPLTDTFLDQGGNGSMATYTFMRWTGPASETVEALKYPKSNSGTSSNATDGLDSQYAYDYDIAHVSDAVWIPLSNRDAVKRALMQYGAGSVSYYHKDSYVNKGTTTAYHYKQTASPDSSSFYHGNHAVAIIGWDDSYSKTNFKSSHQPDNDGAWIVRNSWGSSWGDSGYFYLSYEESASLNGDIHFYAVENLNNYENCYQYDGTSNGGSYLSLNNNAQVANVFTARSRETLNAVAIALWDEATTYNVKIYKNPSSATNPSSGTLMTSQNGYFDFGGYRSVYLEEGVTLEAGDVFSVVFTLSTPAPDPDDNKYVHLPIDATANMSWVSFTHANNGNSSFYKQGSGSWYRCPSKADFRIKAYTDDARYAVTATSNNTAYGTVSVRGNKITAKPADGYYLSDARVTAGTATCTVNGRENFVVVNPTSNCTVQLIFAKKPQLTVSYSANGASVGSKTAYIYDSITLPATVNNVPNGWSFVGWSEAQVNETTAAPAFYAPGAEYVVDANTTLYALYTRVEVSSEIVYEIVTEPIEDWTGKYIITCGKDSNMLLLKGLSKSGTYQNTSSGGAATLSASGMTLDGTVLKNATNAYVFDIAAVSGGWSIKNASTGTYLISNGGALYSYTSYAAGYSEWDLEYDTYNICMKASNSNSASYPYLVKSANGNYFVLSNGFTVNKTQFWKQTHPSTTYYNTKPTGGSHNHQYGAWTSNNNGTHSRTCSCGDRQTANCTYTDVVTPPTTTSQGYTTHTCTVCGYSYRDSYTDPIVNPVNYTVRFSVPNGVSAVSSQTVAANSSINLPTAGAPAGHSFVGWVTSAVSSTATKPNVLTGSYKVSGNVTLYALYSYVSGNASSNEYALLGSAPADWNGKYVITFGTNTSSLYVLKGLSGEAKYESSNSGGAVLLSRTGMSYSNGKLTGVTDPYVFELATSGTKHSIRNIYTNTYLGSHNGYLYSRSAYNAGDCLWSLSCNSQNITATNSASSTYPYMSFYTGGRYFMLGKNVPSGLYFWKQSGGSATYYTTSPTANSSHSHSYGAWYSNYNGSHSRTCSCGEKQTMSCTYTDVVTAPTTKAQGYTTHTCNTCGYAYRDSYTDPVSNTTYTVSFSVPNGVSAVASQTVTANSSITLPTADAPAGYTFLGWVSSAVNNATARPANVLTGSYKVSGNITLRALYSYTASTGGGSEYALMASAPSDWNGNYVITFGTNTSSLYVLKGLNGDTAYESGSSGGAVLLSNTGMSFAGTSGADARLTGVSNAYVFNIAATGAYYTIRNVSTNTYLVDYSSYLYSRSAYDASYCRWTLNCNNGNMTVRNASGSNYAYLSFYNNSKYFMANNAVPTGLYFWKQSGSSNTTYYTTG